MGAIPLYLEEALCADGLLSREEASCAERRPFVAGGSPLCREKALCAGGGPLYRG